jgi:hypothetical protein
VLGYQNTAQNLAGSPAKANGNAMILPFPSAVAMSKDNAVDTSACPGILKAIAEAVRPRSRNQSKDMRATSFSAPVVIYETGIYTVVLARDPRDVPAALAQVPIEKRPDLKPEIFEAYAKLYPGWQIQVCCFNNLEAIDADPLLFWYEPAFPDRYFVPTLDSHTGDVPDLEAYVELDHTIAVMSNDGKGDQVTFAKNVPSDVRELLPRFAVGRTFSEDLQNGDFLLYKKDADRGHFLHMRLKPGGNAAITL